jgi:hypothetical protein
VCLPNSYPLNRERRWAAPTTGLNRQRVTRRCSVVLGAAFMLHVILRNFHPRRRPVMSFIEPVADRNK